MSKRKVPRIATLAINVKGGDLLFLDHLATQDIEERDQRMWQAAGVNIEHNPFRRVIVYTPLKEDGINRYSLRSNPEADIPNYSETRDFALGIQDIWSYLHLFFDKTSTTASALIAEIEAYFQKSALDGFTLADILTLFEQEIDRPKGERKDPWSEFNLSTIRAVKQRFKSLPATLKGLVDVTGKGFGLGQLTDLRPYDIIVIDIERIMANPSDLQVAESTIKIITAYVLKQLTEAMTRGTCEVDHVIVFADELNRLAPRNGNEGIGEYLSQLARTTRDRGIVLFGAGQFRSGINEDILKAASVHYSMRTPEHELSDRMYAPLSQEFKARLTQLEPGQALLQYPSLRTAVFTQFPRPFVMSGAQTWKERFPPREDRSLAECIWQRLGALNPSQQPSLTMVKPVLDDVFHGQNPSKKQDTQKDIINLLRTIEMSYATTGGQQSPWQQFKNSIDIQYPPRQTDFVQKPIPPSFSGSEEELW